MNLVKETRQAWQYTALALFAAALLTVTTGGLAQADTGILVTACNKVNEVWTYAQHAIYIIGGIGICICAIFAFIGKFRWGMLATICGGVFLVATANQLFSWLANTAGSC